MENLENGILMISEEHVDYIKAIAGDFPYLPTTEDENGIKVPNKESPLYNQRYRRFAYSIGGKDQVFIADVRDKFCAQYDAEALWTVRLTSNEEGQLSNPIGLTTARAEKTATTKRKLNVIANAPLSTDAVKEDLLADITNSSIG